MPRTVSELPNANRNKGVWRGRRVAGRAGGAGSGEVSPQLQNQGEIPLSEKTEQHFLIFLSS